MEDEPERLEVLDRRLEAQPEDEPLGGAVGPERDDLLAVRPGVDPLALDPEPGDERRARQRGHRRDPTQPEPGQPGADVRVGGEQAAGSGAEEGRLAARLDDPRSAGRLRRAGRGRRREAGPGDADPGRAREDRAERADDPLDEDRLGTPQPVEPVDLDLEQAERRVGRDRSRRRSPG